MPRKKSSRPPRLGLVHELQVGFAEIWVAGVDEVGRGCLAGPVVAGAVILPRLSAAELRKLEWLKEVHDSKLVRPEVRERLEPEIRRFVRASAIGVASVEEIDRINIYHASHLAMQRALEGLEIRPDHILVDGNRVPKELPSAATAIIKGDQKCLSIALASILAKVWRDREMARFDLEYPHYGFAVHKGYSTPQHQRTLREHGVCAIHRRTFAPVAGQLQLDL